jgi:diguanylate cyclase
MIARIPSEIARETLKLLVARRLAPTPDNYQALYDEVSGNGGAPPFPAAALDQIIRVLPAQTPAQKRLLAQLQAAVTARDWSALQTVMVSYASLGMTPVAPPLTEQETTASATHLPQQFAENLARMVDNTMPALGEDDAQIHEMAAQLARFLRQDAPPPVSTIELLLGNFAHRLSFATEDQATIRNSLLELLHMVFENIAALSEDDSWLQGQAEALQAATTPPLTLRRLDDVQRRLKDVIFRQTEIRDRAAQAQNQMKELLATFIDRLAQMSESSTIYHDQLSRCAERISQATQLHELAPLLEEAMTATRAMTLRTRMAQTELHDLRERAEARHTEMRQLREELEHASAQARHDTLTGSLNRKGLDEAVERELARARRNESPLCVAMLDLDNFKAINDRLGHTAGDAALKHLTAVIRETMRPQDQLARYGGEEFVLLLPDTGARDAVEAMTRLQRALTTRDFLQGEEHVLITVSAGVTQVQGSEPGEDAIRRADDAMYLAKRAGKNRVVAA